ncbi:acyl-CoA dehydrogenase family protein [Streptomyces sp. CC219B]|uniref:acyl-CoA dehydrogenase family protein n=1 Tax=Streptomyces sp. CC219B TaxID=3044574 RepID=UPI0024A9D5F9|nr:acyl-CoA dehydrogenase family protein [Streptomyces sp. CC219B]
MERAAVRATTAEARIRSRTDGLERALAPFGSGAVGGEEFVRAERVLDDCEFGAEFVPAEFGGRLERIDGLGRVVRPALRRDLSLGFGYGLNCFFAATPVWTAGNTAQREWTAALLLGGGRMAVARPAVAHANDFVRDEFALRRDGGRRRLDGAKTAVCNYARARGLTVVAGTEDGTHEILLIDREILPEGALRTLHRYRTVGLDGIEFGGLEFSDCPVPDEAVVGEPGRGMPLVVRCSVVTRALLPSVYVAAADTMLRTAVRFAVEHKDQDPYGPLRSPYGREVLTGALLDLLVSDSVALAAARGIHLLPDRVSACAAAAAYTVPKLLQDSAHDLSTVLGEAYFDSKGRYGAFGRMVRDLPLLGQGHAGTAARQAMLVAQLPHLARDSWLVDDQPPAGLLRPWEDLPPADLGALAAAGTSDPVVPVLQDCAGADGELGELVAAFLGELRQLRERFARMEPGAGLSAPDTLALTDRYALVCAAAASLGVWREHRGARPGTFLADPAWITGALHRLGVLLGLDVPKAPHEAVEQRLFDAVLERYEQRRSYDLYETCLEAS